MKSMTPMEEMKAVYERAAATILNYQELTKNELVEGYLKAENDKDEGLRSAYCAALMLRYWFKIYQFKQSSKGMNMPTEDFIEWLEHAILYALEHKSWLDPTKPVFGDPNGPDKVINQCCESTRLIYHQASNRHNRKANYNTASIDQSVDENGDCSLDYYGATESDETKSGAESVILKFLEEGRGTEALILDGIAYQDSLKTSKESCDMEVEVEPDEYDEDYDEDAEPQKEIVTMEKYHYEYADRKLMQHLTDIDEDFMKNYFEVKYDLTDEQGRTIYEKFMQDYFDCNVDGRKVKGPKLYKCIEKTKLMIAQNPAYVKMLLSQ